MTSTVSSVRETSGRNRRSAWILAFVVVLVTGLGILKLNLPFHNDQATFANYARMMDQGATLYEDVWDPKQPGVFYFFLAGGRLFGFDEAGFHLLEVIYLVAGGVVGGLWLRRRLINGNVAFWYPLLTVGWFYLLARRHDPGQVEVLAGPLILGHIILSLPAARAGAHAKPSAGRLLAAGILVGLLGWLKLLLMAIPAMVAVVAAVATTRGDPHRIRSAARYLGWQFLGVAIPLLGMVVWFAATGVFDSLWYTFVTYPLSVLGDRTGTVLNKLAFRTFVMYLPLATLAVVALAKRARYPKSRTLLMVASVAVAASAAVVLTQTWWTYQANLALFPAAILAVFGIDQIVEMSRGRRLALSLVVLGTLIPALIVETPRVMEGVEHRFGFAGNARAYQSAVEPEYAALLDALDEIDLARDDVVFGTDNRVVWLSERQQAIPISPWLATRGTPDLTAQAIEQLEETPADWVFLDRWARGFESTAEFRELLETDYRLVTETDQGEWWRVAD